MHIDSNSETGIIISYHITSMSVLNLLETSSNTKNICRLIRSFFDICKTKETFYIHSLPSLQKSIHATTTEIGHLAFLLTGQCELLVGWRHLLGGQIWCLHRSKPQPWWFEIKTTNEWTNAQCETCKSSNHCTFLSFLIISYLNETCTPFLKEIMANCHENPETDMNVTLGNHTFSLAPSIQREPVWIGHMESWSEDFNTFRYLKPLEKHGQYASLWQTSPLLPSDPPSLPVSIVGPKHTENWSLNVRNKLGIQSGWLGLHSNWTFHSNLSHAQRIQ